MTWEDGLVRFWQERHGSLEREMEEIKWLLTKMYAGVRKIHKNPRVNNNRTSLSLAGAVAFGERLQSLPKQPSRAGTRGDKYCHLCLFPSFSFLLPVLLDDRNGPQKAQAKSSLRRVLLEHRSGFKVEECGSGGTNGEYPDGGKNLQVMKSGLYCP